MIPVSAPRTAKLAEARKMTLRDHVLNTFRLVIKELRSIRSDPTMLLLVIYAFSISVNTVATGAVTEATNLSVGIVDEDGSDLSRQIAEGLVRPTFQPPVQITASEIDGKLDKGELLLIVEIPPNFQANVLAQRLPMPQGSTGPKKLKRRRHKRCRLKQRLCACRSGSTWLACGLMHGARLWSSCAIPSDWRLPSCPSGCST